MNEQKLKYFRNKLCAEKIRIEQSLRMAISDLKDNADQPTSDSIDEASALSQTSMSLRMKGRDNRLLEKVKYALVRIDEGIFGECDDCGEPIGEKRLRVRPVTTLCVMCKEKQERQERAYAD